MSDVAVLAACAGALALVATSKGAKVAGHASERIAEVAEEHLEATTREPTSSRLSDWLDYYGTTFGGLLPAEILTPQADDKDLERMPPKDSADVYRGLLFDVDPGSLLVLADRVDFLGYTFAANRLRQKAFRLIV